MHRHKGLRFLFDRLNTKIPDAKAWVGDLAPASEENGRGDEDLWLIHIQNQSSFAFVPYALTGFEDFCWISRALHLSSMDAL